MRAPSRKVYVLGVGQTQRGYFPEKDWRQQCVEAAFEAVDNSDLDLRDMEHIWFAHYPSTTDMQYVAAQMLVDALNVSVQCGCTVVEKACSSSGDAIHNAFLGIGSGVYDAVLVLGSQKHADSMFGSSASLAESGHNPLTSQQGIIEGLEGGREGMQDYIRNFVREEHIYELYHTWYWYASKRPKGVSYGKSYHTKEAYFKLPYDNYPFRFGTGGSRYADGGSAAVLVCEEIAKKHKECVPIEIVASVGKDECLSLPHRMQYRPAGNWKLEGSIAAVNKVWKEAKKMAGVDAKDFDVFQPHDNTPMKCWKHIEEVGLASVGVGEGPRFYAEGQALPGGTLPSLTAGLCKGGYVMACVALDQMIENIFQLREMAEKRQVPMKNYVGASIVSTFRPYVSIVRR